MIFHHSNSNCNLDKNKITKHLFGVRQYSQGFIILSEQLSDVFVVSYAELDCTPELYEAGNPIPFLK